MAHFWQLQRPAENVEMLRRRRAERGAFLFEEAEAKLIVNGHKSRQISSMALCFFHRQ
jgi:hypothetical protein